MVDRGPGDGGLRTDLTRTNHAAATVTLTRSVGALQVRGRNFVVSQLPPLTQLALVEPANASDGLVSVQTEDGLPYLVFACDLREDES